jgi:hypothetical protein
MGGPSAGTSGPWGLAPSLDPRLEKNSGRATQYEAGGLTDVLENVGDQWAESPRNGNRAALGRVSLSVASGRRL